MKKINLLRNTFLVSVLMLAGCTSKISTDGQNSFYDEVNCITYRDLDFHLGDTLFDINNTYAKLSIQEEKMIPPEDIENPTFTSWSGQKYIEHADTTALNYISDDEKESTFLYANVTNNTSNTISSYSLPIDQYDTQNLSYCEVILPDAVQNIIIEHIEEEEWSYYDEEKLCYVEIISEEISNRYQFTANIIVYKDQTFNENLEYQIEGILYIRTDEQMAKSLSRSKSGLTDETLEKLPDLPERREVFLNNFVSLQKHNRGIQQQDKTRDYAEKVLDFVAKKRNEDFFLQKDDKVYTILESYQDFLSDQALVPTVTFPHLFQPVSDQLGAYGNASSADTVRYSLTTDEKDSNFQVYPSITNFNKKSIKTRDGLVTKVERYGGYTDVTVPEIIRDAVAQYWFDGTSDYKEYKYDKESVVVYFTNNTSTGNFFQCMVEVTPVDYPEITICYEANVSFSSGVVTDAHFWLKDEPVGQK